MPKEFNGRELKGVRWDFLEEADDIFENFLMLEDYLPHTETKEELDKALEGLKNGFFSLMISFKELYEGATSAYQEALREPDMENKDYWKLIWFYGLLIQRLWSQKLEESYPGTVHWNPHIDPKRSAYSEEQGKEIRIKAGLDIDPSEQPSQPEADYEED